MLKTPDMNYVNGLTDESDDMAPARGILNAIIIGAMIGLIVWLCQGCVFNNDDGYSPEELRAAAQRMQTVEKNLKTIDDAKGFLSFYEYIPQYSRHYPSVIEVFAARLHGNCVGAAVLSQWVLNVIGVKAQMWELDGGGWGNPHTVTITNDKTLMVTNDINGYGGNTSIVFKPLNPDDWEEQVLGYFNPPYQKIKEFKP